MNTQALPAPVAGEVRRLRLELCGQVQGVGFRPHAYRCAQALDLAGWVLNHGAGVTIEVEGLRAEEFVTRLTDTLPTLARIDELQETPQTPTGERGFRIQPSSAASGIPAIPADVALCDTCLQELFDPRDRRYLHPFIACCDCGPRYSMALRVPYDRSSTSMAAFSLCSECSQEYRDPNSRRLHAEPVACHHCGPSLSHPVERIADALRAGEIVALKGIGGYHLLCDARNATAVDRLRQRKRRDARPFAVMLANSASAAELVELPPRHKALLEGKERPIVILNRRPGYDLPQAIAPGLGTLGVLLPYTGVHYLVFHELLGRPDDTAWLHSPNDLALVMTSANLSGEPMLTDDEAARESLGDIADLVVSHTRRISHGCDDSVVRATPQRQIMLRRGRGYAPAALPLAKPGAPVLALGAHLKNTVCATREDRAFLSSHIGDLESPAIHQLLQTSARELLHWLKIEPQAIACDLHPDYASTRFAEALAQELDLPLLPVQHHHAHIAAIAAAAKHQGPTLGLALDGHGVGTDGGSWGGELLRVEGATWERLGHLQAIPLPGGDRAAREPWRIATGIAEGLGRGSELPYAGREPLFDAVRQLARGTNAPSTTACGRYFDAAAALLGICNHAAFEAAAPMALEAHCQKLEADRGLYTLDDEHQLNLNALFDRLLNCNDPQAGAALFHGTLIEALVAWVGRAAEASGLHTVALGGGCFLNRWLADVLPQRLEEKGFTVLTEWQHLSPGDGGIALGQAWVVQDRLEQNLGGAPEPHLATTATTSKTGN